MYASVLCILLEQVPGRGGPWILVVQVIRVDGSPPARHVSAVGQQASEIHRQCHKIHGSTTAWALQGGLSKLAEAESTVDSLSSEAQEQRVALTAKQAEVDVAMEAIEAAMEAASSRKAEVERLSAEQEQASHAATERKV